ncbi:hypothetical protein HX773_24515 [Pantoea sp. B9002]|uniref:hypothetical protein n=1 Tax=Pantoea sp. B9002 TaxID=2726979 RepID=UPI0015A36320|nr:hypothetical protein [Pantoea sp. B9002]NWA64065.1 hypothetical protein [Pantoea sp. B9002]
MFGKKNKPVSVSDEGKVDKSKKSELPKALGALVAANNKLVVCVFFVGFIALIAIIFAWNRSAKVDDAKEVLYVQLYPDGTSKVLNVLPKSDLVITKAQVDHDFEQYLNNRYGQHKGTIRQNYSEASVYLDGELYKKFIGKDIAAGDFDAAQKAADVLATPNPNVIDIEWGFSDHYDSTKGTFDKKEQNVMRSNIYFDRITRDANLKVLSREHLIDRIQWRLMSQDEIKKQSEDWIRANPRGMKIISEDLIVDPSKPVGEKE